MDPQQWLPDHQAQGGATVRHPPDSVRRPGQGQQAPPHRRSEHQRTPQRDGLAGRTSASGLPADDHAEINVSRLPQSGRHTVMTTAEQVPVDQAPLRARCSGSGQDTRMDDWDQRSMTGLRR